MQFQGIVVRIGKDGFGMGQNTVQRGAGVPQSRGGIVVVPLEERCRGDVMVARETSSGCGKKSFGNGGGDGDVVEHRVVSGWGVVAERPAIVLNAFADSVGRRERMVR